MNQKKFGPLPRNKLLKFCCENCDYFTDKKSNIDAHNLTAKHQNNEKSRYSNEIV